MMAAPSKKIKDRSMETDIDSLVKKRAIIDAFTEYEKFVGKVIANPYATSRLLEADILKARTALLKTIVLHTS
jgi:hypothetical protein